MADNIGITATLFTEKITELRRRIRLKNAGQFILYALCVFLLLHGLALAAEKMGLYHIERNMPLYLLCSACALFATAGLLFIRKLSLAHLLIEIDDRFALQDRLSTAYEYQQTEKKSIFSAKLLEDAARHLKDFGMKKLLPLGLSRLSLLFILAGLANLLLLFVEAPVQDDTLALRPHIREHDSEQDGDQMPEQQKNRNERVQKEREEDAAYQRMKEKAEELQRKSLPPQERTGKLQEMLQEVQAMQERLADAASAQDASTTIEDLPIRQLPQQQGGLMPKLQSLEEVLQSMLSDNVPGTSLNSQELPPELQEQLSELLEELDARESDSSQEGSESSASNDDAEDSKSSSGSSQSGEGDRRNRQNESVAAGNNENNQSGRQEGRRMAGEGQDGDTDGQRRMEGERSRASAGSGMSDGQEYPPSNPESSDGPIRQDRIQTTEQDQYNMHIRSVTEIGKARLPEQDLTRPYRQEVESALQQEEMPLNYREYIKNYFLSIGLTEKE